MALPATRRQPGAQVIRPRRGHLEQGAEIERGAALALRAHEDAEEAWLGLVLHHFDLVRLKPGQLDRPIDGVLDEADLIDQAVVLGLIGGEDLPRRQLVQGGRVLGEIGAARRG